jgi:hypothetical protein
VLRHSRSWWRELGLSDGRAWSEETKRSLLRADCPAWPVETSSCGSVVGCCVGGCPTCNRRPTCLPSSSHMHPSPSPLVRPDLFWHAVLPPPEQQPVPWQPSLRRPANRFCHPGTSSGLALESLAMHFSSRKYCYKTPSQDPVHASASRVVPCVARVGFARIALCYAGCVPQTRTVWDWLDRKACQHVRKMARYAPRAHD